MKIKIFLSFLLFYSSVLALGINYEWHEVWSYTGINFTSQQYSFGDIRNVTNLAEFQNLGLNPRIDSFVNEFGQYIPPYNYPYVWSFFSHIGVDNSSSNYFGIVFFMLFSIGIFFCIKVQRRWDVYIYVLLLFSPTISLIIERGNNDQVAFFFVILFCVYHYRNNGLSLFFYYAAFLTKIFPLICIFSKYEKYDVNAMLKLLLMLSPVFIYFAITYPEFFILGNATPISSPLIGYGWKTYSYILEKYLSAEIVNSLAFLSSILIIPFFFLIKGKEKALDDNNDKYSIMFKSGMLIYISTYLVGTSFDYRLVFLLLTVPFILNKFNSSYLYKTTIFVIIFLFWSHQVIVALLYLSELNNVFKYLAGCVVVIKCLLHYTLMYLFIVMYKNSFRLEFFGRSM